MIIVIVISNIYFCTKTRAYPQGDRSKPVFPGAGRLCGAARHQLEC